WSCNYPPTSSEIPVKYFRNTCRQARNYSPTTSEILLEHIINRLAISSQWSAIRFNHKLH
ncbi:hypothetical protein, partial [Tannerella forsythia]|uniref:hypothetical protein n=1 Tax=Tannerella forsythia TaxID=28112 RepID=UPI001C8AC570